MNQPPLHSFDESFHKVIRQYTESLNLQKKKSLDYLKDISKLTNQLQKKDHEIERLIKLVKEQQHKLGFYQNVLNQSIKRKSPMKMSDIIRESRYGVKFAESFIQKESIQDQDKMQHPQDLSSIQPLDYAKTIEIFKPLQIKENYVHQPSKFNQIKLHHNKGGSAILPLSSIHPLLQTTTKIFNDFFILTKSSSPNEPEKQTYIYKYKQNQYDEAIHTFLQNILNENINLKSQNSTNLIQEYNSEQKPERQRFKNYVFLFNSQRNTFRKNLPQSGKLNEIDQELQYMNPSLYNFGICLIGKQKIIQNNIQVIVPIIYAFITYYPFIDLFKDLIKNIIKETKYKTINHNVLTSSLKALESVEVRQNCRKSFNFINKVHELRLPARQLYIQYLLCSYSKAIFKNYNIELIIDILMLLLLELPITLYSCDLDILGKFMHYFACNLTPLKYPFPIIVDLPKKLELLFESPFPTMLGCRNMPLTEKYNKQRAIFDLDKKIALSWPMIMDEFLPAREFILKQAYSKINIHENKFSVNHIIKLLLENGSNIKEISSFWNYFTVTQMYKNYHQDQMSLLRYHISPR